MSARGQCAVWALLSAIWWILLALLAVLLLAAALDEGDPVVVALVATLGILLATACWADRR